MTDLDRRKFLLQGGTSIGGLLTAPRLGLLGLLGAATAAGAAVEGQGSQGRDGARVPRRLLRSGEAVNARGEPLGHGSAGIAVVRPPALSGSERALVVIGHDRTRLDAGDAVARRSSGISVIELAREGDHWRHDVAAAGNRRFHLETPVPFDGARLLADGRLERVQEQGPGVGEISCVVATPWNTVLCGERDGWVIEVNPASGVAVRRFSIGRVAPSALRLEARAGSPVELHVLTERRELKFVTHQRLDARAMHASHSALLIGELWSREGETWVPLTAGLEPAAWRELLRDARGLAGPRSELEAVTWERSAQTLSPAILAEPLDDGTAFCVID